jgi:predicted hydrocarbon binding protein
VTNPVLGELRDAGDGRVFYRGERYLLIRPETLAALLQAVEGALGAHAGECLAAAGRAGGGKAIRAHEGDGRARAEAMMRMGTHIGWGEFTLEHLAADALAVTVKRSPFAEAHGPAPAPVCHLTRGVLEALAAAVLASPVRVVETACVAAGAAACRFETERTG